MVEVHPDRDEVFEYDSTERFVKEIMDDFLNVEIRKPPNYGTLYTEEVEERDTEAVKEWASILISKMEGK